jgi:hypothetical protein
MGQRSIVLVIGYMKVDRLGVEHRYKIGSSDVGRFGYVLEDVLEFVIPITSSD